MLGAIAGDTIGSPYEANPIKTADFPLFAEESVFTDDSVLTAATAHAILNASDYGSAYRSFGRMYRNAGYGGTFIEWIFSSNPRPYNSWGNGSAMRVSPVGLAFDSEQEVLTEARKSAAVTHNHPEGIKGAQATALAVYLARTGLAREQIKSDIQARFGYDLDRRLDEIRRHYRFDVSCQGTVPEAIIAFLESTDFEDAVRKAVSLGGDSDTLACITGSIAHAYYRQIPHEIIRQVRSRLPCHLLAVLDRFADRYRL